MRTAMRVAGAFVLAMVPALSAAGQTMIEALPPAPTVEPLYPVDAVPVRQMPLRQAEPDRPVRMAMVEQAPPTPAMFEVPALVSPLVPSYRKPAPVPVVAAPVPHFVAPEVAIEQAVGEAVVLPANSMIVLHVDGGLSSSDGSRAGDTVKLTVARDVRFGGRVVIAGAFKEKGQGKAGKTILFGLLTGLQGASQVRGEDAEFSADRDLEAATTTAVTIR
jgi:hypothetical protein